MHGVCIMHTIAHMHGICIMHIVWGITHELCPGVTKSVRTGRFSPQVRKGTVGPLSIMGPLSYMGPLFYVGPL